MVSPISFGREWVWAIHLCLLIVLIHLHHAPLDELCVGAINCTFKAVVKVLASEMANGNGGEFGSFIRQCFNRRSHLFWRCIELPTIDHLATVRERGRG